jgi:hypothetical protein
MSAEEATNWKAWLRRNPQGLRWWNWVQASVTQMIDSTKPRAKGEKLPRFSTYLYKPPPPLEADRLDRQAARRQERKNRHVRRST